METEELRETLRTLIELGKQQTFCLQIIIKLLSEQNKLFLEETNTVQESSATDKLIINESGEKTPLEEARDEVRKIFEAVKTTPVQSKGFSSDEDRRKK
jgi:hypothetical protein